MNPVAWLQLSEVSGIGVVLFDRLVSTFGSPEEVLSAGVGRLIEVQGISERLALNIVAQSGEKGREAAIEELEKAKKEGVLIVTSSDEHYPVLLSRIYAPPPILYVLGRLPGPDEICVAIVGTRRPSSYGRRTAAGLAVDFAASGITVVSGCADGIDSTAHDAVLDAAGRTIAVLGSGLGEISPASRRKRVDRIIENGAVISEFPMGMSARPENYPRRNRILSGLSAATIVVEAPEQSGALITASYAAEQSRELFVVPGRIDEKTSEGCNRLIQDGAGILLGSQDVIAALARRYPGTGTIVDKKITHTTDKRLPKQHSPSLPSLEPTETRVYEAIGEDPGQVDELSRGLGMPVQELMGVLLSLEIKGVVRRMSGSRYERC